MLFCFHWLFFIIAVLVRINLGSPVLFKQPRPGKDEKIFYLIPIFCLLYNIIVELKDEQETKKTKQYKKKKNN